MAPLGQLTWTDLTERAAHSVLAVPIGSTEQHGPHLPLDTDTDVARALAEALAERRGDVIVAPALPYGASGEHAGFPGTLSIGLDVLEAVLVELGRSADAFAGLVFVSGHGGNAVAVRRAVERLGAEGRSARAWAPGATAGHDAHAGRTETALQLARRPHLVRRSRAAAGATRPLAELLADLRRGGVAAVSANGVLGDPAGASAAEGAAILGQWTAALVAALDGWP